MYMQLKVLHINEKKSNMIDKYLNKRIKERRKERKMKKEKMD